MKEIIKAMRSDAYRVWSNLGTYLSIIGIFLICIFSCMDIFLEYEPGLGYSVIYCYEYTMNGGWLLWLIYLTANVPFGISVYQDLSDKYFYNIVIETGYKNYAVSKVIVGFLGSFLTVFSGISLFIIVLKTKLPWNADEYTIYWENGGSPVVYLILCSTIISSGASLFSMLGMYFTLYKPKILVAVATPFAASYIIGRVSMGLPMCLQLEYILYAIPVLNAGFYTNAVYEFILIMMFIIVIAYLFVKKVKNITKNGF